MNTHQEVLWVVFINVLCSNLILRLRNINACQICFDSTSVIWKISMLLHKLFYNLNWVMTQRSMVLTLWSLKLILLPSFLSFSLVFLRSSFSLILRIHLFSFKTWCMKNISHVVKNQLYDRGWCINRALIFAFPVFALNLLFFRYYL